MLRGTMPGGPYRCGPPEGQAETPAGKRQMRMVFSEIGSSSFRWRWESSGDGGKTWRAQLLIDYRRRGALP